MRLRRSCRRRDRRSARCGTPLQGLGFKGLGSRFLYGFLSGLCKPVKTCKFVGSFKGGASVFVPFDMQAQMLESLVHEGFVNLESSVFG